MADNDSRLLVVTGGGGGRRSGGGSGGRIRARYGEGGGSRGVGPTKMGRGAAIHPLYRGPEPKRAGGGGSGGFKAGPEKGGRIGRGAKGKGTTKPSTVADLDAAMTAYFGKTPEAKKQQLDTDLDAYFEKKGAGGAGGGDEPAEEAAGDEGASGEGAEGSN